MAFAEKAAGRLGEISVDIVADAIKSYWRNRHVDIEQAPHVARMAIAAYLKGSFYSGFTRERVEAWALWRLSLMPYDQGANLLAAAAMAGKGDLQSILYELVKYFSTR